jgi:hypothetical protein
MNRKEPFATFDRLSIKMTTQRKAKGTISSYLGEPTLVMDKKKPKSWIASDAHGSFSKISFVLTLQLRPRHHLQTGHRAFLSHIAHGRKDARVAHQPARPREHP